ncbi:adenylate/guanylate cyclase domain-containing protein [Desulfobacterales bacterium HSG16]|nr:adenylate/guanylate cyclase domain-containing protein [Desulfobacterales bacterium HSG16]
MVRKYGFGIILMVLICTVTEMSIRYKWLDSFETIYSDLWHRWAGKRVQTLHTAIIVIDDRTLLKYKDEPLAFWSPKFATIIDVLRNAGANVIGLDFMFSVSAESWFEKLDIPGNDAGRTYDIPIRAELAAGKVIPAAQLAYDGEGRQKMLMPLKDYVAVLPNGRADLGLTNLYMDKDGVVRHYVPSFTEPGQYPGISFATLLALTASDLKPEDDGWQMGGGYIPNRFIPRRIGYVGPPLSIPRISFSRLLLPDVKKDPAISDLKGKIVIIGVEQTGSQDLHLTPYARPFFTLEGKMMSGPEIHANIIETLLTGRFPEELKAGYRFMYLAGILFLSISIFMRVSPWSGFFGGMMIGAGCFGAAFFFFERDIVVPTATIHFALVASYLAVLGFRLTGEERKRTQLRQMFGRYVSDEVVEQLVASGKQPDLGGELYEVTVFFSDIRNFTTISEKLSPAEVIEMLNAYFSKACEPILQYGGTVDKFIGDAVMALFGAPVPSDDHALQSIQSAVEVMETAIEFRSWMEKRFPDRNLPNFDIGIGLHTGEAIVGNVGSPKHIEYTAIGDSVNTASRLEGKTKELGWKIIASREVIQQAGDCVQTGGSKTIRVKGKDDMIDIFEVLSVKKNE